MIFLLLPRSNDKNIIRKKAIFIQINKIYSELDLLLPNWSSVNREIDAASPFTSKTSGCGQFKLKIAYGANQKLI